MSYPIKPVTPQINRRLAKLYGVVAAWPFAERGGTVARDVIGGNNGALQSGVSWTRSVFGPALLFDGGVNSHVDCGLCAFGAEFTLSAWVRRDASASLGIFGGSNANCPEFRINSDGTMYLLLESVALMGASTGTVPLGVFTHVAVTYKNPAIAFYINGALAGTASSAQTFTTRSLYIGGPAGEKFVGIIDFPMVSNRSLPAALTAALTGPDPALLYRQDRRNVFAIQRLSGLLLARRRALIRL